MQLLKFNTEFSQVPISVKIILQELLGSKMTLQTYLMIWRGCIFVTQRSDFNCAIDTQERLWKTHTSCMGRKVSQEKAW